MPDKIIDLCDGCSFMSDNEHIIALNASTEECVVYGTYSGKKDENFEDRMVTFDIFDFKNGEKTSVHLNMDQVLELQSFIDNVVEESTPDEDEEDYHFNELKAVSAFRYKGTLTPSTTSPGSFTPKANVGDLYKATNSGYIDGVKVTVGDVLICNIGSAAATSSNYSTIKNNWIIIGSESTPDENEDEEDFRFDEDDYPYDDNGEDDENLPENNVPDTYDEDMDEYGVDDEDESFEYVECSYEDANPQNDVKEFEELCDELVDVYKKIKRQK